MRFAFIAAKKAEHRVTILCRCMRVTRSGFYAWRATRAVGAGAARSGACARSCARSMPPVASATVGPACGRTCGRTAKPSAKSACGA